jgi:hypothetical protein
VTEKEVAAGFFLLIGGGERESVVPVLLIGDTRPMACRSGGNVAQHHSPVPGQTCAWGGQFEADLDHCSTGSGPNH